jgi:hypothetical protein
MAPFQIVGDSRDEVEQRLGDLMDVHLGPFHSTVEEREKTEATAPDGPGLLADHQLSLDL